MGDDLVDVNKGDTCGSAVQLDDSRICDDLAAGNCKKNTSVVSRLAAPDDEDWYLFRAIDWRESNYAGPAGAWADDKFHIVVQISGDSGVVFDVYAGSCGASARVCDFDTNFEKKTNFKSFDNSQASGFLGEEECIYEAYEMPPHICQPATTATADYACGADRSQNKTNYCNDQSSDYIIRVYRNTDRTPENCGDYTLTISNG